MAGHVTVRRSLTVHGLGPRAEELREFLADAPADAVVSITSFQDRPFDLTEWTLAYSITEKNPNA